MAVLGHRKTQNGAKKICDSNGSNVRPKCQIKRYVLHLARQSHAPAVNTFERYRANVTTVGCCGRIRPLTAGTLPVCGRSWHIRWLLGCRGIRAGLRTKRVRV